MTRQRLLSEGVDLLARFCRANALEQPEIRLHAKATWRFGVCAYYRTSIIHLCLEACADIGTAGRSWSCPGYTVDRTPVGVIQHELGHHVDVTRSTVAQRYRGDFSVGLRRQSQEVPISGYCPDDGEWFAEMFRVFVTNPDLLRILRPRTYALLRERFQPAIHQPWDQVLAQAPERTRMACARKISQVR